MRKRIFEIIQIGNKDDFPSKAFDIFITVTIFLNILVMVMETFGMFDPITDILKTVEWVTICIFTVEYILRIYTADFLYPNKSKGSAVLHFLLSYDGVVDLLTILPFFFLSGFVVFRMLRVFRILHLFRLNPKFDSFEVIASVCVSKRNEILSIIMIISIIILASSLCLFNVEHEAQPEVFKNGFSGFWCSMATILTIGYGDIYPVTTAGRLIAGVAGLVGICATALVTGVLSAGFLEKWNEEAEQERQLYDIEELGEIVATEKMIGHSIEDIHQKYSITIALLIRDDLYIVPTKKVIIQENDILMGHFSNLKKKKDSQKAKK